jgi:hypothetical protein
MLPLLGLRRARKRRAVGNEVGAAAPSASSSSSSKSDAEKPSSRRSSTSTLDDLCFALRRQNVVDLKLGWHDCVHVDYTKRRQVQRLARALEACSSLQRVRIGCSIRRRAVVATILRALAASKCLSIQSFQLILDPGIQWLPEEPLKELLVRQTRLEKIELRGVQAVVCTRVPAGTGLLLSTNSPKECPTFTSHCWSDRGVVSWVIVHLHRLERLATLELVDCNVTDKQANQLADFLHVRGGTRVSRLSLRLNRRLTSDGLRVLCQAPVMDQLDLSLCELYSIEAKVVAASIAKRPWPLRELVVCGNSQIGASGWMALTSQECCRRLTVMNLSYCVSTRAQAAVILDSLGRNLSSTSTLQEIIMHGCAQMRDQVGDSIFSESLCRLLRQNSSLRAVRLSSSNSARRLRCSEAWSPKDLSRVLEALRANYDMEVLLYDSWRCDWAEEEPSATLGEIRNGMDFVLRLNQAGRRHLLDRQNLRLPPVQGRRSPKAESASKVWDDEWLQVLEKAGRDDLDVLYWVVREGADRFEARV